MALYGENQEQESYGPFGFGKRPKQPPVGMGTSSAPAQAGAVTSGSVSSAPMPTEVPRSPQPQGKPAGNPYPAGPGRGYYGAPRQQMAPGFYGQKSQPNMGYRTEPLPGASPRALPPGWGGSLLQRLQPQAAQGIPMSAGAPANTPMATPLGWTGADAGVRPLSPPPIEQPIEPPIEQRIEPNAPESFMDLNQTTSDQGGYGRPMRRSILPPADMERRRFGGRYGGYGSGMGTE